jgi:crotonobetainyl-CoA:carnitine CoA-transferase CaiB-like acyl-CoA transferase
VPVGPRADRPFAVGAGTDRHFRALCCEVLAQPELAGDARFSTNEARVRNRAALVPLLEGLFSARTARSWLARCRKVAIPASAVRGVREALETPAAAPLVATVEHPVAGTYRTVTNPLLIDGSRYGAGTPPPLHGEQTDAILRELGHDARSIAALRKAGVIAPRTTSGGGSGSRRG